MLTLCPLPTGKRVSSSFPIKTSGAPQRTSNQEATFVSRRYLPGLSYRCGGQSAVLRAVLQKKTKITVNDRKRASEGAWITICVKRDLRRTGSRVIVIDLCLLNVAIINRPSGQPIRDRHRIRLWIASNRNNISALKIKVLKCALRSGQRDTCKRNGRHPMLVSNSHNSEQCPSIAFIPDDQPWYALAPTRQL